MWAVISAGIQYKYYRLFKINPNTDCHRFLWLLIIFCKCCSQNTEQCHYEDALIMIQICCISFCIEGPKASLQRSLFKPATPTHMSDIEQITQRMQKKITSHHQSPWSVIPLSVNHYLWRNKGALHTWCRCQWYHIWQLTVADKERWPTVLSSSHVSLCLCGIP